jgi:prepilin-type N-terminal cleavage/methylation domain-containing protein
MKLANPDRKRGFSLIETVIAIGVLAVLLTGFMIVFAPAAAGIRRAINMQEADRLASTLEQELVTSRSTDPWPGFNKAFDWIKSSDSSNSALLVYQYRGSLVNRRADGTPEPMQDIAGKLAGRDFTVMSIVRRKNDPEFLNDLTATEGGVYLVKCTQLVYNSKDELVAGKPGEIRDPNRGGSNATGPDDYPEAVIAFAAEFHALPGKSANYFGAPFEKFFTTPRKPIFTRNLAVRR